LLFSVIIPVYNCKSYLMETVDQIRNAGLWDYEILLIDDGSTDGTKEICDGLVSAHEEVRCIHQPNAGVSHARNRGIREAKGEYILFFDADDGVDAGALCHAARIVQEQKPDMLVFGMSFDYYFHGRRYRRDALVYPESVMMDKGQFFQALGALYRCNALSPVWNKFIRRSMLKEHSVCFAGSLIEMEDFVFSMDCLRHCETIYVLSEVIYRYRQAENERNTYDRLCRIDSLSGYMDPIRECIENVIRDTGAGESLVRDLRKVVNRVYLMLLRDRLRFASPGAIGAVAEDMLAGPFAEYVAQEDPVLFQTLKDGRNHHVWLRNCRRRIRHWLAVRVKYLCSLGR